ncbi:hypothetical protein LCGC14_2579920 [marine sediment metagenome]|uniref:Uncharacterized protein n=1 Tax=marine sediment metagenome TaxID=412755 RepID=A0A0F9CQU1_9ZZZZ
MGVIDYDYFETRAKFYYLKNTTTGLYFAGFSKEIHNKPLWTSKEHAVAYEEQEALRIQRRLENLYSPAQKIIMEEK